MKKSVSILIFIILFVSILSPVFVSRPTPMDQSVFFNTVSTESSEWNVSENGSLQHQYSVFPSADYLMWNRSNATNQLQWWSGGDTIIFNGAKGTSAFSALMANNSQSNRSQSLLWGYVNGSGNFNSENVFLGPIWMNTSSGNATMVLYGQNCTFVLNRAYMSGSWALFNTEDFSYGGHAGWVVHPDDGIDYYNETIWGEMNLTEEGFFIKSIYNTYCGRIQSKAWGSNETYYTLMQEPSTGAGWVVDNYFANATTDNSTLFGLAVWNPLASSINVSFDYINFWKLNYSLNASDTISWKPDPQDPTETHPRPHMEFPILNMSSLGTDLWQLIMPSWAHGLTQNMTNDSISLRLRNLTNNMSMESRAFDVHDPNPLSSDLAQNDSVYYYTSVLTNFTDWYISYLDSLGYSYPYDDLPFGYPTPQTFSNNYLAIFVQQCEDGDDANGDLRYDFTTVGIDVDNNRVWNSNDRFILTTDWHETYSWTGNDMDFEIIYDEDGILAINMSNCIGLSWYSDVNYPANIHRYASHFQTLILVPLWSCVKSNGEYLDNGDTFGLHVSSYNDRPGETCVWENWQEKNCTTFFDESDPDAIADLYYNKTNDFIETGMYSEEMGICITNCDSFCWKLNWDNFTNYTKCLVNCWETCVDDCDDCNINIENENLLLWGDGKIPGSPIINSSSSGHFDINISIDINISYFNESQVSDNQTVNISFVVCNDGDETLNNIKLNLTWLNCSCSLWKFWYLDSNVSEPWNNITYYNDSCHAIFNLSDETGHNCSEYWISFNISECANDTYGEIWIEATVNTSSGIGASDTDSVRIIWGIEGSYLQITGAESVVSPFEISGTVLFFVGICLIIAALLAIISVVSRGGRLW